mmetsp:Transcript_8986/g.39550  ORF Transcript_8986/g.39550 Transcript_8986/m.39550 type:complete len:200 (-) Transcript_8986:72-671(-)
MPGVVTGMQITASHPSCLAASAVPCAWLPADEQMTPLASDSFEICAMRLYAPRSLNEKTGWRSSRLRWIFTPYFSAILGAASSGDWTATSYTFAVRMALRYQLRRSESSARITPRLTAPNSPGSRIISSGKTSMMSPASEWIGTWGRITAGPWTFGGLEISGGSVIAARTVTEPRERTRGATLAWTDAPSRLPRLTRRR